MERCLLTVAALVASGCWTEEPLIHGAFTEAQWAKLQHDFAPPEAPSACDRDVLPPAAQLRPYDCEAAARFGQQLFFEPRLSGPLRTDADGNSYPAAATPCSTCHAATASNKDPAWYTDLRTPNEVSQGAEVPTPHNTMSLVNVAVGDRSSYGWSGTCDGEPCDSPNDVVNKIALPKAMRSTSEIVSLAIRTTPAYMDAYVAAFGVAAPVTDAAIQQNVELALNTYMRRLVSTDAPFDDFIRGNDDAISDEAKRGFALFVGRAMCAECHRGGTFSDDAFHVTGVDDPTLDNGHAGTGAFYTVTLRNVAKTAPYMHKGSMRTLGDVIDFYSRGGGTWGGYAGRLDPLMHPFELSPDEALDLQAFLVALTGNEVDEALRVDTHVAAPVACKLKTGVIGVMCNGACTDAGMCPP
jgi:cytochrome c peroxidase